MGHIFQMKLQTGFSKIMRFLITEMLYVDIRGMPPLKLTRNH